MRFARPLDSLPTVLRGTTAGMSPSFGADDLAAIFGELERVSKMGWYVWDVTAKDAAWSDGMYRLLGLPPRKPGEPASGEAFYELVHPDDRARVRLSHMRIFTEGAAPDVTYRIQRPDGETRVIRGYGTVVRDSDGKVVRVLGALTDVTDIAIASNRLEETDARLAEIEEAIGVGSHVEELTTRRIEWSRTLHRLFGVEPEVEPTLELVDALVHPEDRARRADWARRVENGEVAPPLVIRIVRTDGTTRWIETRGRRVESPTGPRVMGLTIDVTSRVELEERWRQAAKLEAVGTLAAGIAHDFNNYLAVMMLESGSASAALKTAIQQCRALTNQLIGFARRHPIIGTIVDVAASIVTTVELFQRLAEPNVKVVVDVRGRSICVVADSGQLDGILMNLLINARDAMPSGGTVHVRLEVVDIGRSAADLHPGCTPGRYAKLSVVDEGVGIAEEQLPRIFEPYFSTKALSRGTGLGLASVYTGVKQHGGFIRVESCKDRGSTFEVHLPLADATPDGSRPEPSEPARLSGSVLVVEDMPELLEVAARILSDAGLMVHTAASGDAALELLRRTGPVDVVLTDVAMPGMGGLDLAQALATVAPRTNVVLMSAYLEREIPHRLTLQKPFEKADLLRIVAKALGVTA
jgi:two-component system cell cycle sensor histidine kinase/response regulator CckA